MATELQLLRESIKTNISAATNVYDVTGQWLPPGNYYFLINYMGPRSVKGELNCRGFKAEYTFTMKDTIRMMAGAQARLARRASISDDGMPSYRSPATSPVNEYPTMLVSHQYNNVQPPHTSPTFRNNRRRLPNINTRPTCTICLDFLDDNPKILPCQHKFHLTCITRWYATRQTCPVCRRAIPHRSIPIPGRRRTSRYAVIQRQSTTTHTRERVRREQGSTIWQRDRNRRARLGYRNQQSLPSLIS